MKLLIAVLATAIAGGVQAQDLPTGSRVIVVQGKATLRHAADFGQISYRVSGDGATQVEALQALAANRAKEENALVSLARVKAVEIQPSPFEITEVNCAEQGNPAECRKLLKGGRFTASLDATAKVTPSDRTGDAASLVAEKGAEKASVSGGGLSDGAAFAREVSQKALENARAQAETIAAAQGVRLGRAENKRVARDDFRGAVLVSDLTRAGNHQIKFPLRRVRVIGTERFAGRDVTQFHVERVPLVQVERGTVAAQGDGKTLGNTAEFAFGRG